MSLMCMHTYLYIYISPLALFSTVQFLVPFFQKSNQNWHYSHQKFALPPLMLLPLHLQNDLDLIISNLWDLRIAGRGKFYLRLLNETQRGLSIPWTKQINNHLSLVNVLIAGQIFLKHFTYSWISLLIISWLGDEIQKKRKGQVTSIVISASVGKWHSWEIVSRIALNVFGLR